MGIRQGSLKRGTRQARLKREMGQAGLKTKVIRISHGQAS